MVETLRSLFCFTLERVRTRNNPERSLKLLRHLLKVRIPSMAPPGEPIAEPSLCIRDLESELHIMQTIMEDMVVAAKAISDAAASVDGAAAAAASAAVAAPPSAVAPSNAMLASLLPLEPRLELLGVLLREDGVVMSQAHLDALWTVCMRRDKWAEVFLKWLADSSGWNSVCGDASAVRDAFSPDTLQYVCVCLGFVHAYTHTHTLMHTPHMPLTAFPSLQTCFHSQTVCTGTVHVYPVRVQVFQAPVLDPEPPPWLHRGGVRWTGFPCGASTAACS